MRIEHAIFFGSALAVLATPCLAGNTEAQRTSEPPATTAPSSTCQSYQQAADGSWKQLPCQELWSGAATQRKSSARSAEDGEH